METGRKKRKPLTPEQKAAKSRWEREQADRLRRELFLMLGGKCALCNVPGISDDVVLNDFRCVLGTGKEDRFRGKKHKDSYQGTLKRYIKRHRKQPGSIQACCVVCRRREEYKQKRGLS